MRTQFKNVIDILDYYKDENKCVKLLEQQRWNGKPVCPHCGNVENNWRTNRGYRCSSKGCQKKFSVTVGTIYENSKLPLRYWFAAIYLITAHKKGISSHQLARDLGITQKSAWFVLHRVREMLIDESTEQIGGNNMVESDATAIGGKEEFKHGFKRRTKDNPLYGKKRVNNKEVVVALVERGGKIMAKHVQDEKSATVIPLIQKHVQPGATISTDEGAGYRPLSNIGFKHIKVAHVGGEYVDYSTGAHTNTLEGAFSLFKRGVIGIYHSISPKHLQRYCTEFSYRYNSRKTTDCDRFIGVLAHSEKRLRYSDLIADKTDLEIQ